MSESPQRCVRVVLAEAVCWLLTCAGALAAAQSGLLSVERLRSAVEIENAYGVLAAAQAFFIVFLFPLFEWRQATKGFAAGVAEGSVRVLGLLVLSAPLVLLARQTAGASAGQIAAGEGFVLLLGVCVGAAVRLPGARVAYYPVAFLLSGGVPLVAYLLFEGAGVRMGWAGVVSPLWAAGSAAGGVRIVAAFVVWGAVAGMSVGAGVIWKKKGDGEDETARTGVRIPS